MKSKPQNHNPTYSRSIRARKPSQLPVCIQTIIARLRVSGFLPVSLLLFSLACSRGALPDLRPPTATPVTIRFLNPAENPVPAHDPLVFDLRLTPALSTPTPTATPVETPAQAVAGLPQVIPAQTFDSPTPALPTPTAATPDLLTDTLILLAPAPGSILLAGQDTLEFKWAWQSDTTRLCYLPPGYGFEVRIWPNPDPAANPHLTASDRQTVQPWGVADAAAARETIAASCDPRDGTWRYTVAGLSRTPGVSLAAGRGHFYWDVAYGQLQPSYAPVGVSRPGDFSIPAAGSPAADPNPAAGCPAPAGTTSLLEPPAGHLFPATPGPVQFRWRWQAQTQSQTEGRDPCHLPPGYGFELRLWSKQPGFAPLGVLDAVAAQEQIACDPSDGTRTYTVAELNRTPGVKVTYVGEYRWDGQFRWDVALICLDPYRPSDSIAPPRDFEIALSPYPGPLDPFGPPLTCADFRSWPEAQALFLAAGGPARDPHHLDPDANDVACDSLRQ